MAHFGIHFSEQPFCIHIANVLGMISGFFKCTSDIWVTLFGDSWFFYVSRQLAANASVWLYVTCAFWPAAVASCSNAGFVSGIPPFALLVSWFDSLARVGLLGPCWCHLQGYEGVSGVHPAEDVGLHGRQLHHTTYVVPTGTPMCRQDQVSLQAL